MLETLKAGLPRLGLTLTDAQVQTLCDFGNAVIRQNEVMNLTAITEPTQVAKLHLLDSLTVLTTGDFAGKTLIDVGCGAGFPGVPLAIACPELKVTLLDSLGKRVHWLEEILPQLGVQAECVTAREELAECTAAIKKLGLQLEGIREFPIDGTSHALILLKKIAPTPKQYPRRYAKIKQSPL